MDFKNKRGLVDGIRLVQDHFQNIRKDVNGTEQWIKLAGINFLLEIIFIDFY